MEVTVREFLHYNTCAKTGQLFVHPEELVPCRHKTEQVVRLLAELNGSRTCPTCNKVYTDVVQLSARDIEDFCLRNGLQQRYSNAAVNEMTLRQSIQQALSIQRRERVRNDVANQFKCEDWVGRTLGVILFLLFWKYFL